MNDWDIRDFTTALLLPIILTLTDAIKTIFKARKSRWRKSTEK